MHRIKVLQLVGSFNRGGSETQAIGLARGLVDADEFDVSVATLNAEGPLLAELRDFYAGDVAEYPLTSFFSPTFVRRAKTLASYARGNAIDIIHTHDFYTNVFAAAAQVFGSAKVRIASKRETLGMRTRAQEFVETRALTSANAIVVNSAAVERFLLARGIAQGKLHLVYNGVDLERFSKNNSDRPSNIDLPHNARTIVLTANLRHHVKNVPLFLRAAQTVAGQVADVHFAIAGEGELRESLVAMARDLEIADRVTFLGGVADVSDILDKSFACVLTSDAEGFSNSILEYMAAGKPVVATRVGGADEAVIDGETGYLIGAGDAAALSKRLLELLRDPAKAESFGACGRSVIEKKFSREAQVETVSRLYRSQMEAVAK